ncbi:MAG: hypothetical protein M1823_003573 [Watsoniomyces obsoletus]|nr:MAG: hypothetical protein M1823_003573 [Watsoniomyces obsoletus]
MPSSDGHDDPSHPPPGSRSSWPFWPVEGERSKRWLKMYRTEIAASSSSILSTCAAYPLDSVKTRMQAYGFHHVTDCVKHTYRTEGAKGFWRGSAAPLFSITLVRTVSFSIYQKAKYVYSSWIERVTGSSPLIIINTPGSYPTLSTIACFAAAGATAGGMITTIACPFELTKLSAQIAVLMARSNPGSTGDDMIRRSYQQKGTFRTAANIIRHKGLLGLYSGFHLHLLRDTLGTALYFMTYESGKQIASSTFDSPASPLAVVMAGGLCGIVSWACIYPIDSAKSIYQRNALTHPRGSPIKRPKIQFFNRQMYRGLGVSMGRSCIVNAIFFSAFEYSKRKINELD